MPTGAELFVRTLGQLGIGEIFTLVGDHLNEVLAVAARAGMRIVDLRHESGVTHAADAWARITRKPALSLVTGGPGHTNSLTGIATANLAASPLIAVSGGRATTAGERGAFQDIEQVEMARPVCKWAAQPPNAAQIPFYLGRAYAEANSGRKGAVHLTIPVDLFTGVTDAPSPVPQPVAASAPAPGSKEIGQALALLKSAARPVVIAGSGVWWGDACQELRLFLEKTGLPLYTITMARGAVSDEHPLCLGYADPALNQAIHTAFREADVFLVLGKRIDYRLALGGPRLFSPQARFIQIDLHPQELGMNRKLEVAICADVKAALSALLDELGDTALACGPWVDRLRLLRQEWSGKVAETARDSGLPLHPAAFYAELKRWLPTDVSYSWDGGDFAHWGRVSLPALRPGRWLRLGPLGTIGSALPNSLALQLANPGQPVVMITGDGSLGFYLAELDSLVRHKLPVVLIVGNDGGWGLERELQGEFSGGQTVACELARSRYDLVMKGFGGDGETIDTLEQVRPAVQRALASGVPYLLNVNIRGARSPFTQWQIAGKKK
ncbi:MAG: thiamine pyrophosphate-binding protein [Acidobacteria bacterium]|nr:thiamine pyrophosphate-binding protein [Acidobacteriota bacterium]MBI3469914.1 thiamine pyrophosphate-binding protein [Candidatus Solibacter usitatus]